MRSRVADGSFRATEVDIFRPYPDEVPWELLDDAGADKDALAAAINLNLLRVAKHRGLPVGVYAIRPLSATCYELVILVVADGYRRKGLGRWLLGHAIGLAETKGGREVVTGNCARVSNRGAERFLGAMGFESDGPGLRLILTPE